MSLSSVRVHLELMQSQNWLPWQRPLVAGCRQYLHSVGRPLKPPPSITNRLVAIVHTKPLIAILVPKLVAMAMSLRPSISGMSSLDSLTRKPTPRIKRRVASCHTAEVISIQSYLAHPHTKGTADLRDGRGTPTMFDVDVLT